MLQVPKCSKVSHEMEDLPPLELLTGVVPLTEFFSHCTTAFWEFILYFTLTSFLRKIKRTRPVCFIGTEVIFEFLTS